MDVSRRDLLVGAAAGIGGLLLPKKVLEVVSEMPDGQTMPMLVPEHFTSGLGCSWAEVDKDGFVIGGWDGDGWRYFTYNQATGVLTVNPDKMSAHTQRRFIDNRVGSVSFVRCRLRPDGTVA